MKQLTQFIGFLFKFAVVGLALAFIALNIWPGQERLPWLSLNGNGSSETPAANTGPMVIASYAEAVNRAAPSVVSIYTNAVIVRPLPPALQRMSGRQSQISERRGLGSGVILSEDGYIVTNLHVVRSAVSNAGRIVVQLWDGRFVEAQMVGNDIATDLAVLKVDLDALPKAPTAASASIRTGDIVLAIGNARGLSHTVTMGIVSATGRNDIPGNQFLFLDFIQTDAAINQGNSGGALVNAQGEVVGINTSSLRQVADSISFAIPIELVKEVMDEIIEYGSVQRSWLGASFASRPISGISDVPTTRPQGVVIQEVYRNGPAAATGLQQGDVILAVDGQAVNDAPDMLYQITQRPPGTTIEIEVMRGEQVFTNGLVLQQQPLPRF